MGLSENLSCIPQAAAEELQTQKQKILSLADDIAGDIEQLPLDDALRELSGLVANWRALARQLRYDAGKEGFLADSGEIAGCIRELAMELDSSRGMPEEALFLIGHLQTCFGELPALAEQLEADRELLKNSKARLELDQYEEQESFRRNRMDKKYVVTLQTNRFSIPPYCTCCMKPTSTTETVNAIVRRGPFRKYTVSASGEFPICPECLHHRKQVVRLEAYALLPAVALSIISIPALAAFGYSGGFYIAIPLLLMLLLFILFGLLLKLPAIGPEHSTWQRSVQLTDVEMRGTEFAFTFRNWRYARLFAQTNQASGGIVELDARNKAKSAAFLKAIDMPGAHIVCILLISWCLFSLSEQPLASAGNYYARDACKTSAIYDYQSSTGAVDYSGYSEQARQQRLDKLDSLLYALINELENLEKQLDTLSADVDACEAQYNKTGSSADQDLYNQTVDAYNSLLEQYNSTIDACNKVIAEYDSILE